MKIILEPDDLIHSKITIETPRDCVNIRSMVEELIIPALLAYGFSEKSINSLFETEVPKQN